MPKAVHDCVDKVKGEKGVDSAWAICNAQISEVATALGIVGVGVQEEVPIDDADALPDPEDYASHPTKEEVPIDVAKALPDPNDYASHPTKEEVPIDVTKALPDPDDYASHPVKEHHNPLDIPFGHEVKEKNMNVKDVPGPDDTEEGGLGSGRNPEGGASSTGGQPGPLISFGETILKEMMDSKLSCPCNKKK